MNAFNILNLEKVGHTKKETSEKFTSKIYLGKEGKKKPMIRLLIKNRYLLHIDENLKKS